GEQHFAHRADDVRLASLAIMHGQRIEPALRTELRLHAGGAERGAANRPVAIACIHRAVGIPGLMRAVERADPEMDDADLLGGAVVGEAGDFWREVDEGFGRESHPATSSP